MKTKEIRVLVTGAGTGSSANLIRALRTMAPKPYVVGVNDDRFVLKLSIADISYLSPDPASRGFTSALLDIIERERINVAMATDDNAVKALSDRRRRYPIDLLLPRRKTGRSVPRQVCAERVSPQPRHPGATHFRGQVASRTRQDLCQFFE